jgi:hypothetical protein
MDATAHSPAIGRVMGTQPQASKFMLFFFVVLWFLCFMGRLGLFL